MAALDAEDTIDAAVRSALAQTDPRLEVIVIDDGSRIPVAETLASIDDPRVRIVRHERNRGLSAARNTGLRRARAPLVAQLDADDLWEPDYLVNVLPRFENPSVGLVYSNAHLLGHPRGQEMYILDSSVHPLDRFPKFAEQNPVPSLTAAMRTDAVRAVGGYATWLRHAMDYYLYAKLICAGWRFDYIDRCLASYRWPAPDRGMSWDTRTTELSELKMWLAFVARHPTVPGPRRQVRMRLGRELTRLKRPFARTT
jgi:glycosyltransferase involved in cell wall biosynthesis